MKDTSWVAGAISLALLLVVYVSMATWIWRTSDTRKHRGRK